MYTRPATSLSPALIVYLIDASRSMSDPCGQTTKIDVVNKALRDAMKDMVRRSMRDSNVQPRYHIAIFAYSTAVIDVLDGIRPLPELVQFGPPVLSAAGSTDTTAGFAAVACLLDAHIREYDHCPAPLVCHLTDALLTTSDPQPMVQRLKSLRVEDGPVLVENVYVADSISRRRVRDWHKWGGILKAEQLTNDYARFLFGMSSPLPESYRENINNHGYALQSGAALFFPGANSDLVRLAFAASAATQLK
jgi:hypothetical protein